MLFYGVGDAMTAQALARGMKAVGAHAAAELCRRHAERLADCLDPASGRRTQSIVAAKRLQRSKQLLLRGIRRGGWGFTLDGELDLGAGHAGEPLHALVDGLGGLALVAAFAWLLEALRVPVDRAASAIASVVASAREAWVK